MADKNQPKVAALPDDEPDPIPEAPAEADPIAEDGSPSANEG